MAKERGLWVRKSTRCAVVTAGVLARRGLGEEVVAPWSRWDLVQKFLNREPPRRTHHCWTRRRSISLARVSVSANTPLSLYT